MARLTALALVAAALSSVAAVSTQAASRGPHTVLHYGDSLTVGTAVYLPAFLRGWAIRESASVSRHTSEGPAGVRALGSSLPRVIVISLGANDDPSAVSRFAADVRRITAAAGARRCVIWSTIVRPPYDGVSYEGYNAVLRRAARSTSNLRVFDWDALARANPQWFGSDGVHPTAEGYRARAAGIARIVKAC
jgi:lysophospholipase L1-like esterase